MRMIKGLVGFRRGGGLSSVHDERGVWDEWVEVVVVTEGLVLGRGITGRGGQESSVPESSSS